MQTFTYVENSLCPEYQSLDIYLPKTTEENKKLPCIIYVFGGGFQRGNKSKVDRKPQAFTDRGFIFISINYRLSPSEKHNMTAKHPDHIKDVAAAISWIYNNIDCFNGDIKRIFLMGHSSGAFLATLVSTDDRYLNEHNLNLSIIKGTISLDISGYNLLKLYQNTFPLFRELLENAFGKDPNTFAEASPIKYIKSGKNIPPFLLSYTRSAALEQNQKFANELISNGIKAILVDCTSQDHFSIDIEIGIPGDRLTQEIFNFIESI